MPAAVVVGKSVLLLEENTTSRDCLANILFEKQFTVTEASSEEALIIAWRDESDPVVFDLVSEGMKYVDLNRAAGLEGATKAQAEEILGLTIKTAIPDMESNFALANHLHQPLTPPNPAPFHDKAWRTIHHSQGNGGECGKACATAPRSMTLLMKVKGNFRLISTTL